MVGLIEILPQPEPTETTTWFYCSHCDLEFEGWTSEPKDVRNCPQCQQFAYRIKDLAEHMLVGRSEFLKDKIKAPLRKVLIFFGNRRLKVTPTHENVHCANTHILLDIWEKFFELENNPMRDDMFMGIARLSSFIYDSDAYYRNRFEWFVEQIVEAILDGRWSPRPPSKPDLGWRADLENRGRGYVFMRLMYDQYHNQEKR